MGLPPLSKAVGRASLGLLGGLPRARRVREEPRRWGDHREHSNQPTHLQPESSPAIRVRGVQGLSISNCVRQGFSGFGLLAPRDLEPRERRGENSEGAAAAAAAAAAADTDGGVDGNKVMQFGDIEYLLGIKG